MQLIIVPETENREKERIHIQRHNSYQFPRLAGKPKLSD